MNMPAVASTRPVAVSISEDAVPVTGSHRWLGMILGSEWCLHLRVRCAIHQIMAICGRNLQL